MNIVIVDSATGEEQYIKLTEASSTENFLPGINVENNLLHNKVTEAPSTVEVIQGTVEKPHVCQVCGKGFGRLSFLNVHMRVHTGEKPYSCTLCEAAFSGQTALQRHLQRHNGVKAFKCQYCDKSYVLKNQCKDHEKIHTETPEDLKKCKCSVCGRAYRYPFQLKVHYRVHTGEKPVECEICNKHFTSGKILYEHVRRVHKKDKPYKCSQCERQFSDFADMKRHLTTHSNEKPFKCDECGMSFKRKYALKRHIDTKVCVPDKRIEKAFLCTSCDRSFALQLSLDMHIEIVHGNNDDIVNIVNNKMENEETSEDFSQDAIESNESSQVS